MSVHGSEGGGGGLNHWMYGITFFYVRGLHFTQTRRVEGEGWERSRKVYAPPSMKGPWFYQI